MFKYTGCSSQDIGSDPSTHVAALNLTSVLGAPAPSTGLSGHCMHMISSFVILEIWTFSSIRIFLITIKAFKALSTVNKKTPGQNTHTYKNKLVFKNKIKILSSKENCSNF